MSGLQQTLGLLVARLAHDLKNPLAAVLSNLSFLQGSDRDADEREALDESLFAAARLDRMLDDVVALTRIRAGELEPAPSSVDLAALANDLAGRLALLRGNRVLQIDVVEARLLTDEALLRRVLINLLEHCLRHTPSKGAVLLRSGRDGAGLVLRVVDGGSPFFPGVRPSFLEDELPLRQAPPAGYRSDQGLGLHVAGVTARALGVRTGVAARADGERGVVFELCFPAGMLE